MFQENQNKETTQTFEGPEFLSNLSGGVMCAMSDGANFGPVTHS